MRYEATYDSEDRYKREAEFIADQFEAKMKKAGKGLRFTNDLIALFSYMTDPEVHWAKKTVVVAALLYFIIPIDAIPDLAPIAGYLDDMGVVGAAIKYLGTQLNRYYVV